jgi:hypothetical protein
MISAGLRAPPWNCLVHPALLILHVPGGAADRPLPRPLATVQPFCVTLQSPPRRPALVHAGLVLGDVALGRARPPAFTPPGRPGRCRRPGTPARSRPQRPPGGRAVTQRPRRQVAAILGTAGRTHAMSRGGVATASGSGSRSHSKRDRSCWSYTASSPSSTSVRAESFATAAARSANRRVW